MNPGVLEFEAATHTYRWQGREVPSVTSVIRSHVPAWNSGQFFLDRGTAVHSAVALALADRLDYSSLDARIVGRVNAVLKFIDDEKLRAESVECRMASARWRYAGTADLIASNCDGLVCADWKGSLCPEAEIQLAAYVLLWNESNPANRVTRALAVECHDDSSYRCKWFNARELANGGNCFLAMLSVFNWRETHNLNTKT